MARPAKRARKVSDEIFNVSTLAHYLHCHPSTVYRLLKDKKIPAFKLGSDWRFQRSAIDEWIARLSSADLPVCAATTISAGALTHDFCYSEQRGCLT